MSPAGQCGHAASFMAHRLTQRVKDSARQSLTESTHPTLVYYILRDVMLLDKCVSSYQEKSSAIEFHIICLNCNINILISFAFQGVCLCVNIPIAVNKCIGTPGCLLEHYDISQGSVKLHSLPLPH